MTWEPVGPDGRGGYEWGTTPDGTPGFVPGGVHPLEASDIPEFTDVGGMRHVDSLEEFVAQCAADCIRGDDPGETFTVIES